jgi:hypothetical protein
MRAQMRTFKPENDPHNGVCGSCHNPHTQTSPKGAFQTCATSNCHARSDTLTAMHRGLTGRHKLETCGACHVAHTWKAQATDCKSCHTGITDPAVRVRPPDDDRPHNASPPNPHGDALPSGVDRVLTLPSGAIRLRPASWQDGKTATPASLDWGARRDPTRPFFRAAQGDSAKFAHARHESVSCVTCHTTTTQHGGLKATARQCTACHHGNTAVGRNCASCHSADELAPRRAITTRVRLTVAQAPVDKTLPFEHGRHARVTCDQCHAQDLARTVQQTCTSCHADHHEATRDCASCHPPSRTTHTRALHLTGCAGSGCHDQEKTPATTPVRATCLACHQEQKDHKSGRECAPCHLSTWRTNAASGR